MLRLLGFLACLVLAGAAHAQEIRGAYVGVGFGFLNYEDIYEVAEVQQFFISDSTGGYRLFAGYQLNSNYAIELGWTKADGLSEDLFYFDGVSGELRMTDISVDYEVATLRGLAIAPFGGFSMFGGLGYFDASATTTYPTLGPNGLERLSSKRSDSGVTVIGGIQYDWPRIALRGEYEWLDTSGSTDAQSINLNVLFRF